MGCLFDQNIDFTCADKDLALGGYVQEVYIINFEELDKIDMSDVSIDVASLSLTTYANAFKVTNVKNGVQTVYTKNVIEGAGLVNYTHTLTLKGVRESSALRAAQEKLDKADAFVAIAERSTGKFEILGGQNGLSLSEGTSDKGFTAQTDTTDTSTYTSTSEAHMPRIFDVGGYAATKAYLEALLP